MSLEEEVVQLRAELAEARTLIAKLQQELERLRSERAEPPPFVKPNTPKLKDKADKQPRRKRAKEQNGARRREPPRSRRSRVRSRFFGPNRCPCASGAHGRRPG